MVGELILSPRDSSGVGREFTGLSAEIRDFLKNKEETGAKYNNWTRISDMDGFPLSAVAGFQNTCGAGTYSRGRKAGISSQFKTDKEALWGGGLRAPVGNRFAHASSALTWGAINPDKPGGAVLALADCAPFSYDAYGDFTPDGKKFETRGGTSPCH